MEIIGLAATGRSLQARTASAGTAGGSLLVALHGGGYQATYFEAANGNLHETAARESLGCAAITRPGWAGGEPPFDAAAAVLDAAIGTLCERLRPASVVLVGHSIGGAIEALGLDLLEIQKLTRTTNHRNRVTAAHRGGH